MEPNLRCTSALHSPATGIIDSHAYMLALQGDAEHAGAVCVFLSPVTGATGGAWRRGSVRRRIGADEPALPAAGQLRRAARAAPGAAHPRHAGRTGCRPRTTPRATTSRCPGRSPFSRLIYPVPVPGGLGVHLTIDLGGQARFGPDVEWVDTLEYAVDPARADSFYAAVRKYWPDLKDGALQPGYSGIRPKIVPPGKPGQDFVVQGPQTHGVPGLINLFGIELPGLTASLALADHVLEVAATG